MSQVWTLSVLLVRELGRSLVGAMPPLLTATLYWVTFHLFPFDADYLVSVGGFDMVLVCLATTLLLAEKLDRAATYPLLLRLPHRVYLLVAIVGSALAITGVLAVALVGGALLRHGVRLTPLELGHLLIRWLPLFTLAAVVGLHLSKLVSRHNSHFVAYGVLALLFGVADGQRHLVRYGLVWLVRGVGLLVAPVRSLFAGATHLPLQSYMLALLVTLAYTALLGVLAMWLFRHKELLWIE